MNRKTSGFTLIELMIVVAIIAIIASIAIPNLLSSRLAANETAAIATLRNIVSAQSQFQTQTICDQDLNPVNNMNDGQGEYGFFAELAGLVIPRYNANSPSAPQQPLNPPIMSQAFGLLTPDGADGVVQRSGYYFKMFLPDALGAPVAELAAGGQATVAADADNQEIMWCAYAWPVQAGASGNRAFFVNVQGEVIQTLNTPTAPTRYTGLGVVAGAGALGAYQAGAANMMAPIAANQLGNDGNLWTSVGN